MKALVYNGPRDGTVREAPDAMIERPTDALVRITSANICGSDLHMYEGRTSVEKGKVLGHENLGEVIEVGPALDRVKKVRRATMRSMRILHCMKKYVTRREASCRRSAWHAPVAANRISNSFSPGRNDER